MLVGGHNMHGCWTTRRCWGWFQDGCSHCCWCQRCVDCVDSFYSPAVRREVSSIMVGWCRQSYFLKIVLQRDILFVRLFTLCVNIWNHICLTSSHKAYYVRPDVLHKQWFNGLSKTWCVKGLPPSQESSWFERGFKESTVKIWIRIFICWICITLPISIVILKIHHIGSVIDEA
jgi:hypothetical protein